MLALYPQLGSGELESFGLAQTHHLACLTNDRQAKVVAQALGLSYLDLKENPVSFQDAKASDHRGFNSPDRPDRRARPYAYQSQSPNPQ